MTLSSLNFKSHHIIYSILNGAQPWLIYFDVIKKMLRGIEVQSVRWVVPLFTLVSNWKNTENMSYQNISSGHFSYFRKHSSSRLHMT